MGTWWVRYWKISFSSDEILGTSDLGYFGFWVLWTWGILHLVYLGLGILQIWGTLDLRYFELKILWTWGTLNFEYFGLGIL